MKNSCLFYGWDGSFITLKLQSHQTFNTNIKHQRCTVISCKNWGDHVKISHNGYAHLCYCHAHAASHYLADLIRCEKPRGYFYTVWKGKLQLLYETKFVTGELVSRMRNPKQYLKRYEIILADVKKADKKK